MINNTLYLGDCLEVMDTLPDQSIDMILSDLPYGTTRNAWDSTIPLEPLWKQYKRITKKNAAILLFAQVPFAQILGISNPSMLRYEWIWEKDLATGFLNANRCPMKAHENILVFYQRLPTYHPQMVKGENHHRGTGGRKRVSNNYNHYQNSETRYSTERYPRSVLQFPTSTWKSHVLHPTQKPVDLCEYFILTYSNPGEVVLDSCMGSGTTCIAAVRTGRNSIGIEINDDYFTIAQDRLKKEAAS